MELTSLRSGKVDSSEGLIDLGFWGKFHKLWDKIWVFVGPKSKIVLGRQS